MCGIAGVLDIAGSWGADRLRETVVAMNEALYHRGPDDGGVWIDPTGRCGLGQRRLSVLDLSPQGHQPMLDETGAVGLTYNGEVYNFADIRQRLASQGFPFKSRCDTEVVLRLLAELDPELLSSPGGLPALRGMFALGLWNARRGTLLLARDAFGKKPLYVARGRGWFAFASELRALECIPELDRSVSTDALGEYLLLQYCQAPSSIYRGVEKLSPGSYLVVDRDGRERRGRHFGFEAGAARPNIELAPNYAGRVRQLDDLVEQAVRRRLVSDVPLGAFLSGGVDSALVVAMMRRAGQTPSTFSVGFAESADSEHRAAREIASHFGCDHHEIEVRPDAIELAPWIAESLDEPNGDSSCLPTRLLSRFARRHVTVALSGDGGDEMFGGYGRYEDVLGEASAAARPADWRASEAYLGVRWTIFQPPQIEAFLGQLPASVSRLLGRWTQQLDRDDRSLIHRMRNLDVESYLPGAVLAKVDRMSMQESLEVRCPLLDVDVAGFASALAADDLVARRGAGGAVVKRILRDVLAREMPREWVDRKKKGFGLPAGFWDGESLRDFAREVLDSPSTRLRDHFDRRALSRWLASQDDPNHFSIYRLWPMLVLELWLRSRPPAPQIPQVAR